jgi:hypothetical protein
MNYLAWLLLAAFCLSRSALSFLAAAFRLGRVRWSFRTCSVVDAVIEAVVWSGAWDAAAETVPDDSSVIVSSVTARVTKFLMLILLSLISLYFI